MIINPIDFPIYNFVNITSIIIGIIYIFISLKNENMSIKHIAIFFSLYFILAIVFAKTYTLIVNSNGRNFFEVGLSGYGGLVGAILAAIIYERIYEEKYIIKYTIISLPLIYSFAKIACLLSGCCYGIPYDGILSITYPKIMDKSLFPIQLVEVIVFNIIFQVCNAKHNNKNIIYITLISISIFKFLLDYLRYSHINQIISPNQIFSILLLITTLITYFINNKKDTN